MELRRPTPDDLSTLAAWDEQPHIIAAGGEDDQMDWSFELSRDVPWQEFWLAEVDGQPIGLIQIIDPKEEESHYWGPDVPANLRAIEIWIGPAECLGKGYGTQMMRWALDYCFSQPNVEAVLIDPLVTNERACQFYERLSFERVERRQFGQDDCWVYRLDRKVFKEKLK